MNKKTIIMIIIIVIILLIIVGGYFMFFKNNNSQNSNLQNNNVNTNVESTTQETGKRTAKNSLREGESIQTEDKNKATRVVTGGTKIKMTFGDTIIYGVLNDSETAKALIKKLPITQSVSRYSHDFCGVTEELPYNEEDVHYGWLNGDIDYAIDAPYYTILFEDEDISEQYDYQVNIGVITSPISDITKLDGSYDITIELDED